jgi:hypothetical protein
VVEVAHFQLAVEQGAFNDDGRGEGTNDSIDSQRRTDLIYLSHEATMRESDDDDGDYAGDQRLRCKTEQVYVAKRSG